MIDDWQRFKTRSIFRTVSDQYKKLGAKQVSSTACPWGKMQLTCTSPFFCKVGLIYYYLLTSDTISYLVTCTCSINSR